MNNMSLSEDKKELIKMVEVRKSLIGLEAQKERLLSIIGRYQKELNEIELELKNAQDLGYSKE